MTSPVPGVLGRDKSASPWRKEKAAVVGGGGGMDALWSLTQDLAQLVLFAISIGNESTWLVSCCVLGVHHDLYSLEF